jgi:hypothetical protein
MTEYSVEPSQIVIPLPATLTKDQALALAGLMHVRSIVLKHLCIVLAKGSTRSVMVSVSDCHFCVDGLTLHSTELLNVTETRTVRAQLGLPASSKLMNSHSMCKWSCMY